VKRGAVDIAADGDASAGRSGASLSQPTTSELEVQPGPASLHHDPEHGAHRCWRKNNCNSDAIAFSSASSTTTTSRAFCSLRAASMTADAFP
jgi:hypothetical protein